MVNGDKKGGLVAARDIYIPTDITRTIYTYTIGQNKVARLEIVFVGRQTAGSDAMTFKSIATVISTNSSISIAEGPTDINDQGTGLGSELSTDGLNINIRITSNPELAKAPWRVAAWIYVYELEQEVELIM